MNPILLHIPDQLETGRLLLRAYREGEGKLVYQMIQDNHQHLREVLPPALQSIQNWQDAEVLVRSLVADWQLRRRFVLGMWAKDSHELVGEMFLGGFNWDIPSGEIGYFVVKQAEGRGFATEATTACIVFAFEQLRLHRLVLGCDEDNARSRRVAETCRFKLEGTLRQNRLRKDGSRASQLCFGLIRDDYDEFAREGR